MPGLRQRRKPASLRALFILLSLVLAPALGGYTQVALYCGTSTSLPGDDGRMGPCIHEAGQDGTSSLCFPGVRRERKGCRLQPVVDVVTQETVGELVLSPGACVMMEVEAAAEPGTGMVLVAKPEVRVTVDAAGPEGSAGGWQVALSQSQQRVDIAWPGGATDGGIRPPLALLNTALVGLEIVMAPGACSVRFYDAVSGYTVARWEKAGCTGNDGGGPVSASACYGEGLPPGTYALQGWSLHTGNVSRRVANAVGLWSEDASAFKESVGADVAELKARYAHDWALAKKGTSYSDIRPANLAHALLLQGQLRCFYDDARAGVHALHMALRISGSSGSVEPHHFLTKIYIGQGRLEDALVHARALNAHDQHFRARTTLMYLYWRLGLSGTPEGRANRIDVCDFLRLTAREGGLEDVYPDDFCTFAPYDSPRYWRGRIGEDSHRIFTNSKYVALHNILPQSAAMFLGAWYDRLHKIPGNAASMKRFVPSMRRWEYEVDPFSLFWNMMMVPLVTRIVGKEVFPTYSFPVTYEEGGSLPPHKDVLDNEISFTTQVKVHPAHAIHPLFFKPDENGPPVQADMRNNDGVLYQGTQVYHWRHQLPPGHHQHQLIYGFRTVNASACNAQ